MGNRAEIQERSFEVMLDASVVTPAGLKVLLVALFGIVLALAVVVLSSFDVTEGKGILVSACGFSVLLFFTGKYAAWNLWGREWIRITTKSVLYTRSYGLYALPPRTIVFDYLATNIEVTREYENAAYGIINLYDRNAATMQLMLIFSSGVNLPVSQLTGFIQSVHQLFTRDEESGLRYLPFSTN